PDTSEPVPVASPKAGVRELGHSAAMARVEAHGLFETRDRLIVAFELEQDIRAREQGVEVARRNRQYLVIGCERLLVPPAQRERVAAVEMHLREFGLEREHTVVACDRLIEPLEIVQRRAAIAPVLDRIGRQRK